jgi:hypothetical protein
MKTTSRYLQTTGAFALLSGPVALASIGIAAWATRDNPDAFTDPVRLPDIPNLGLAALRWSMRGGFTGAGRTASSTNSACAT